MIGRMIYWAFGKRVVTRIAYWAFTHRGHSRIAHRIDVTCDRLLDRIDS